MTKISFTEWKLGNVTLPNRFIMGSMHLGIEGSENVSERLITFYQERFSGGVGLIVTGGISVNEEGRGSKSFYQFQNEKDLIELKKLNDGLKSTGILCAQLFHAGRYAFFRNCVAPSAIRASINRYVPKELSEDNCWKTIADFGLSAKLAYECGFGAVEIMGSEGYLINQFCSPVTNKRTDFFGGNSEKRMNFAIEVFKSVKNNLPENFPIIFRMSGIDLIPESSTFDEVCKLAEKLKENGASALNIGIGWHESRIPTISQLVPRGIWGETAGKIKNKVPGITIIASNRINNLTTAENILSSGKADLLSMARPFLADSEIINKMKMGNEKMINTCIACNQACLDHAFGEEDVSCLVNPRAVHESIYKRKKNSQRKTVAIIGAGPGGLQAAKTSIELGMKVILFEKSGDIGGQFQLAAKLPAKSEFKETIRYFQEFIKENDIDLHLNSECTLKELESINPDAVIFSTGVKPRAFNLPGLESISHGDYVQVINGEFKPGKNVAIIGGGGIGADIAHFLAHKEVITYQSYKDLYQIDSYNNTVIRSLPSSHRIGVFRRNGKIGSGLGPTTFWALKQELESFGVEFFHGLRYIEIKAGSLVYETLDGKRHLFSCDSVISCTGQISETTLYSEYVKTNPDKKVFLIGGAKDSSRIDAKRAMREGLEAAFQI